MAWALNVFVDVYWLGEGAGSVSVRPSGGLANSPGFGSLMTAGPSGNAQMLRFQQAEAIAGVGTNPPTTPTSTAITNALSSAATDLGTQITSPAVLAQIQAWATGGV